MDAERLEAPVRDLLEGAHLKSIVEKLEQNRQGLEGRRAPRKEAAKQRFEEATAVCKVLLAECGYDSETVDFYDVTVAYPEDLPLEYDQVYIGLVPHGYIGAAVRLYFWRRRPYGQWLLCRDDAFGVDKPRPYCDADARLLVTTFCVPHLTNPRRWRQLVVIT